MKPETGFFQATSDNLPAVTPEMLHEFYFRTTTFVASEIRGAKNLKAMREEYSSEAVGYVQIKREGKKCTVKARVTPEHRIRNAAYRVTMVVDDNNGGSVVSCVCDDCAASEGGCKHALALLSYVAIKTMQPSPTSVESYWTQSPLSAAVKYGSCIPATNIGKLAGTPVDKNSTQFREMYAAFEGPSCFASTVRPEQHLIPLSMHKLAMDFKKQETDLSPERFLAFIKNSVPNEEYRRSEKLTRSQADNHEWHELRYGRVTASYIYQASRCQTPEGTLVEAILGGYHFPETFAIIRGKELEPVVLKSVFGNRFKKSGLIISQTYPMFGASPDAIVGDTVVEVKCPLKESTVSNYVKNGKLTPKANAQIQLQMKMAGKTRGTFLVADPNFENNKKVIQVPVVYDNNFLQPLLNDAYKFWKVNIYPKIIQ